MRTKLLTASLLSLAAIATAQEQVVLKDHQDVKPIRVAIIGAGAGGSSAAYHLANYSRSSNTPLDITIFDRNDYIGGRSTTVHAYDTPTAEYAVELGASIFVNANQILVQAVHDFGLNTTDFNDNPKGIPGGALGIWDGSHFVLELEGRYDWWDTAKVLWKYGLAPIKTQRLMKSVVGKFLRMYEEPIFPFADLTAAAQAVGLLAVTAATGDEYMRENGISGAFGREVVQASTRVNYAQNLEFIHGLEAMVCMATDGAMGVQGGNWRIFAGMVNASNAKVELKTEVRKVWREEDATQAGWNISFVRANDGAAATTQHFDHIIVATPYQFSSLSIKGLHHEPDHIPYVNLHVTLFTSPHLLSPAFFDLEVDKPVPQVILTTLPDGEPAKPGPEGVGPPNFFSISLLRPVISPKTGKDEYLYKIFSPKPVNETFLNDLLDIVPKKKEETPAETKDSTGLDSSSFSSSKEKKEQQEEESEPITWLHHHSWSSYPYEYPRITFEDIKLAAGLWYTSGMESFISTMETNALMGKNVARLLVDELI